ncbi:holocytochrome c synthase [Orbilia blumenaviensis]|uniref:Holocytochrome c-type synthase n=1 Tax=Orbilia blumenaviensis TaxID=1796055 RepID=A0AAV9UQH4_9PEZI
MGWFWADAPTSSASAPASTSQATKPSHHPKMMAGNLEIPPECPMHRPKDPSAAPPPPPPPPPTNNILSTSFQTHSSDAIPDFQPAEQHVEPTASRPWSSYLNPLNMMPKLSNTPAPQQKSSLPTSRVISSIPKGTHPSEGNWEYPSPQQMYNAMLRKGYDDTPEDAVEDMVDVHNFLNEGAWQEIVGWEKQFAGSIWRSVKIAGKGGNTDSQDEGEGVMGSILGQSTSFSGSGSGEVEAQARPRLLRFQGRPGDLSPKARMYHYLGMVFPQFGNMPFDRHDWYVQRSTTATEGTDEAKEEVRYVIDYYAGETGPTGESIFYLDVRPAIDRPRALFELGIRYGGEIWWKASGGAVREEERRRKQAEREGFSF